MTASPTAVLRENEKLLRSCTSIDKGQKLIPTMIVDPSSSESQLKKIGIFRNREIYHINTLRPDVFLLPAFLDSSEVEELAIEILHEMIDSPPHSNNFNTLDGGRLWKEYIQQGSSQQRLKRLRWSCVGYFYDWGNRKYHPNQKSEFPKSLSMLYESVLTAINSVVEESRHLVGEPQSAIINFYHSHRVSDRLGGHRDDVEMTDRTPLVSVSLGRSGFFLIENEAIVLRAGDVLVMADEARQCLHGVPCVIKETHDARRMSLSEKGNETITDRECVQEFLEDTRISISIRQVY
jgi:DNA alkylation damage repair protein AlkB